MTNYLGLDVGGTKVAVGVVDERGGVRGRRERSTAACRAGGDPLAELISLGREALQAAGTPSLTGVGLALPGPVERETIRMRAAPTIPEFLDLALGPPLEAAFGARVAGDNDANACALAEARFGAGQGSRWVVYFTVSTGIGGGIVVDGRVLRGTRGAAGEFGHQIVVASGGPLCDCGNTGCLEALASGRGIAARGRAIWTQEPDLTAVELAERARGGDPGAVRIWEETVLYLGAGVANVINLLDPDCVVLGGGVALGASDLLLEPLQALVRDRCMPSLHREVPLRIAVLGENVGIVGAACLAMESRGV